MYRLLTFGIPQSLPFDENGQVANEANIRRWDQRRLHELDHSSPEEHGRVSIPGPYDVLLGRGKCLQDTPGNVRYRFLIEENMAVYESASKLGKTALAQKIVELVKESKGRFMKDDGAGWVEVDDNLAREKVSHSFRSLRSSMKPKVSENGPKRTRR